jgi:hypothetical protein
MVDSGILSSVVAVARRSCLSSVFGSLLLKSHAIRKSSSADSLLLPPNNFDFSEWVLFRNLESSKPVCCTFWLIAFVVCLSFLSRRPQPPKDPRVQGLSPDPKLRFDGDERGMLRALLSVVGC